MEHHELFQRLMDCIDDGTTCALVQVLKTDGSTPLKIGAKALVHATGRIEGTIGGGAVEAEAQQQAIAACAEGEARVFDFAMHGASRLDSNPTCGGAMRILIDPTIARARPVVSEIVTAIKQGQPGILETSITPGPDTQVTYHWRPLAHGEDTVAKHDASEFVTQEDGDLLRDPIWPLPHLIIAGAGHVGQALAVQASLIGFAVTVLDDRPEFCTRARFPAPVTLLCQDMAQALAECPVGPDTYVVILTRGHQFDAAVLEACIQRPAAYIGMIGSQRKIKVMRQDFVGDGLATAAQFDRVRAPIGLDIGSVTAAEIATSITAQLIAVRAQGPSGMICAMVLGAGASQRMGTQKLLLPWGAKTVIEHIVDELLASRIDQVLVITGHDHETLALTLANYAVTLVHNDRHAQGMLSSVRCGLNALPETCRGVLVALGDQPTLKTTTVDCLVDQFLQHPGIVLPVYQGKRGHPLLVSSSYTPEILRAYDDTGLRGMLQAHEQDIQEVTVDSPAILQDIDTPEDYRKQTESAER